MGASSFSSFNNAFCRLVKNAMIICLEADTYFLFCHHIFLVYSMRAALAAAISATRNPSPISTI